MKIKTKQDDKPCPCQNDSGNDSHIPYSECCQPIHQDITKAVTAEALMRARYCAYVLLNKEFLMNSWHPETRPSNVPFEPQLKWMGLTIRAKKSGEVSDHSGEVEFIARCKTNGKASHIYEISQFKRHNGYWVYLDGKLK